MSGRITRAGWPSAREPSGISIPCGTSAPAAIRQFFPILAPFKTIAPMPISVLSPTVQPWRIAPVPDGDAVAHRDGEPRVRVNDAAVLDVGARAD